MMKTYDAIIIGGGIIGASCAFHLARRGVNKIAVLDKGPHVACGSTGKSSAVVRQGYTNYELIKLTVDSIQMFSNWSDWLKIKENRCGFSPVGVVWLLPGGGEPFPGSLEMFARAGAHAKLVDPTQLQQEYPSLNLCSRALSLEGEEHECASSTKIFWEPDAGFADPQGTTENLQEAGEALGAKFYFRHEVIKIDVASNSGFESIVCSNGATFSTPLLLNAAGPWCNRINDLLGVDFPMPPKPTRVEMAFRDLPAEVTGKVPVFFSAADEVYGRAEGHGQQLLIGSTSPEDETDYIKDPDNYDEGSTLEFRERMMHKLHHRFAMKTRGAVRGYSGLYTVNTTDWHPIIDSLGPPGYFVAAGFSGHGFKLGPSIGGLIAQRMTEITLEDDCPVDVGLFAGNRASLSSTGGVLA
jgi:glycine/D-amino acid oxidase-like deaminating enzyme